jgi:hypothetical protein
VLACRATLLPSRRTVPFNVQSIHSASVNVSDASSPPRDGVACQAGYLLLFCARLSSTHSTRDRGPIGMSPVLREHGYDSPCDHAALSCSPLHPREDEGETVEVSVFLANGHRRLGGVGENSVLRDQSLIAVPHLCRSVCRRGASLWPRRNSAMRL